MARRKQFLKVKLPFVKKIKINKGTFATIIGLVFAAVSLIFFISFIQTGEVLIVINDILRSKFGLLSVLFPVLLLLSSSHFFASKKLKIIKPHVTVGSYLIFIALIGFFGSGEFGRLIKENLTIDFSAFGAFVLLSITLTVGLILFFNTSLDVFILMILEVIKKILLFIREAFVSGQKNGSKGIKSENKAVPSKGEFISGKAVPSSPTVVSQRPLGSKNDQISIRPISGDAKHWTFPPLSLLGDVKEQEPDAGDVAKNSDIIERTLDSFGIRARVSEINKGPTVTQYALEIVMGTKLSKIMALSNDLALALAAPTGQVRIEAPIPGRSLVGIEIPNIKSEVVSLKRMLTTDELAKEPHPLTVPLGLDVSGKPLTGNITKMPHVLIAGTTGSGKSVILNAWICSLLYRATPQDVRLILVDPKRVELTQYNGIPHLLTEVIVEPDKILSALKWTVGEMENRYKLFAKVGARNIDSYNQKKEVEKVPYIIFIIDELADLMIYAPGEAEESITRIAQMARATGIHLILATQRPSVDVITGLMKANIPSRIAFNVPSLIDSRVVLDMPGAEKLVGKGDMLYLPADQAKPRRIQGPFINEHDVKSVVDFLKLKVPYVEYTEEVTEQPVSLAAGNSKSISGDGKDSFFNQAVELAYQGGKISASLLQRRLSIGYARAARIVDQLEAEGIVSAAQGSKPREVISRAQTTGSYETAVEESSK